MALQQAVGYQNLKDIPLQLAAGGISGYQTIIKQARFS